MREQLAKHKTAVIIIAAIVAVAVSFAAGMLVRSVTAGFGPGGGEYIGAEQARTIALESVGVSPSKAAFTKVDMDTDNGAVVYDVEFHSGVNEYDFEIDAVTGAILKKTSEAIDGADPAVSDARQISSADSQSLPSAEGYRYRGGSGGNHQGYIGINKARAIALKEAGASAADVVFKKEKLDSEDGIKTYEIKFYYKDREYNYEIDAYTGELLDSSIDYLETDYGHDSY